MSAEGAAAHYSRRDDPDSQTAPDEVRAGLQRFLASGTVRLPILEVGCGIGGNLPALRSAGQVVGVEVALTAARRAGRLAPVVAADGARLPFRQGTFGTAVCTEVLEHVDEPRLVFAEIARVLRPDGRLYVTTPNYANLAGAHKWWADRRSGRSDWNPWGAHHGGYEAFMTGRRLWRSAAGLFDIEEVRGLDYGQALTGRFRLLDRIAWSAPGRAVLPALLKRLYRSRGVVVWHGMHIELTLRRAG